MIPLAEIDATPPAHLTPPQTESIKILVTVT